MYVKTRSAWRRLPFDRGLGTYERGEIDGFLLYTEERLGLSLKTTGKVEAPLPLSEPRRPTRTFVGGRHERNAVKQEVQLIFHQNDDPKSEGGLHRRFLPTAERLKRLRESQLAGLDLHVHAVQTSSHPPRMPYISADLDVSPFNQAFAPLHCSARSVYTARHTSDQYLSAPPTFQY